MRKSFPTGLISALTAFAPILISLYVVSPSCKAGFVSACQLCFRNIVLGAANPITSQHLITFDACLAESDKYLKVKEGLILKNNKHVGKHITFLPRKRRSNQPLLMTFNHESNNETTITPCDTSTVIRKIDTGNRTFEAENNQTDFDSVKFFDDLQSSGGIVTNDTRTDQEDNVMSAVMIGAIGFYKKVISPALPPACRFVPTCSTYGVQAIQEFGPAKGLILIAWRILRCTPVGGKGYDPPKWPPVFYTFSSY